MSGYEQQYYQVHPAQLRWAMSQLGAMPGMIVQGYQALPTGMYVITVLAPVGAAEADWRGAPRRRGPRFVPPAFNWRVFVRLLAVLMIVGALGYIGYSVFASYSAPQPTIAGVPVEVGGMRIGPDGRMVQPTAAERVQAWWGNAIDSVAGLLPKAAPPAQPVTQPAPWWRFWDTEPDTVQGGQSGGWTWPPKNPVGDAWDGVTQTITWLIYAVIALGVLYVVSLIMGIVGKFRR